MITHHGSYSDSYCSNQMYDIKEYSMHYELVFDGHMGVEVKSQIYDKSTYKLSEVEKLAEDRIHSYWFWEANDFGDEYD